MRDFLIKQLRVCSFVKGKQKTWISQLSDDQLFEIYQRLRGDESAKSIAKYVQKVWNVNSSSSIHSISQGILKFKNRIAHLIVAAFQTKSVNSMSFDNDIDSLVGMERVAQLQRKRIERMILEEHELGITHSNLSKDLQSLATLSKVIMNQKEFVIRHENDDPVKRRDEERMDREIAMRWDRIMKEIMPTEEERDKVINATNKFMELIEKQAVTIDSNDMKIR